MGFTEESNMGFIEEYNMATKGQLSTKAQFDCLLPPSSTPAKNTSSFTIKTDLQYSNPCDTACRTPKAGQKFSPLNSTFINSQTILSRGKENKKGEGFSKSKNEVGRDKPTDPTHTP